MKKTFITAAIALGLASAAAASTDRSYTLEGIHDYGLSSSGIRLGVSVVKPSINRTYTNEYSVNLGYMTGDDLEHQGEEFTYIPLTVGYHANTALTEKISVFAGGTIGIVKMEKEPDEGEGEDTLAPTITIGAGLKFKLTETSYIRFAYEIGKLFPSDDEEWGNEKQSTRTISLGVGIQF